MHMKRVIMMRPKLVLKESMSVNQYMPPCDEKTQIQTQCLKKAHGTIANL